MLFWGKHLSLLLPDNVESNIIIIYWFFMICHDNWYHDQAAADIGISVAFLYVKTYTQIFRSLSVQEKGGKLFMKETIIKIVGMYSK